MELDPNFALAHAYLANVHGDMYRSRYDRTAGRLEQMRNHAETALRRPREALAASAAMRPEFFQGGDYINTSFLNLNRGWTHAALGDTALARADYETARVALKRAAEKNADDPHLHAELGMVYGSLGRKQEAIRAARRAMELVPLSKDAWEGTIYMHHVAAAYALLGEVGAAVEVLERLVTTPIGLGSRLTSFD